MRGFCCPIALQHVQISIDPDESEEFAQAHDEGVWWCFSRIMGLSPSCDARIQASLPLCEGGLGLRSAVRSRPAAHWASWTDALKMIKQRHPGVVDMIVRSLVRHENCSSIQSLLRCVDALVTAGFDVPSWEDLAEGRRPEGTSEDGDLCQLRIGWQKQAATCLEKQFLSRDVWPGLLEHERAMLLSQQGLILFPTDRVSRFDSQPFRILLLRRLQLPLSLSVRSCRCGRPLDTLGHHRAACATAGVLGRRGWALESVAARVCREAGARVRTNVFVRDMDLANHENLDGRRLEVVADGLPLHGGAQLAIDTTMVSPLHSNGVARRGASTGKGLLWRLRANGRR